ncbi:Nif3-like dinuclear metal center hexameric protein [Telluribacter sp.]|jgi:putative NIF3 family GTP cyclohydrolase 1 type 2|uniref:Nif3-like dinuclear metal center hexameric protein n=1 Tax=Telluribacter sp. TaxID=1978767 RepID=UPI002E105600|nr:Nif3-like dinuclear metal center hexameric protein [Telluribacter sp.]
MRKSQSLNRRKFLTRTAQSAGLLALADLQPLIASSTTVPTLKSWTVQEVIDLIMKEGGLSPVKDTVDTLKSGKADQVVKGIVTTMFPTITVIKEAARLGANFIMAHEPTFYNHLDNPDWVEKNSVVQQKQQLLEKHNIVLWRFHDYIHRLRPDAISYGVAKKAGWLPYYKTGQSMLTIPSVPLKQLVQQLKSSLGITNLRVIGDPNQACQRIGLLPGAIGGQRQVALAEREKPDVLIVGEAPEWETVEYIRDARLLGRTISLIVLGHAVSEEPGMEYFVDWLQPKLPDLKITHVASKDPFTWM